MPSRLRIKRLGKDSSGGKEVARSGGRCEPGLVKELLSFDLTAVEFLVIVKR